MTLNFHLWAWPCAYTLIIGNYSWKFNNSRECLETLNLNQSCEKIMKINRLLPKSTQFRRWAELISMPNFRLFFHAKQPPTNSMHFVLCPETCWMAGCLDSHMAAQSIGHLQICQSDGWMYNSKTLCLRCPKVEAKKGIWKWCLQYGGHSFLAPICLRWHIEHFFVVKSNSYIQHYTYLSHGKL